MAIDIPKSSCNVDVNSCMFICTSIAFPKKKKYFFFNMVSFGDFGQGENISNDSRNKINSLTICVCANFLATLIYFLS